MNFGIRIKWFHKLLFTYIITIIIPALLISGIYLYNYSIELKDEFSKASSIQLHSMSAQLRSMVSQVDQFTLQLTFLTRLNEMINNPFAESLYNYSLMRSNLRDTVLANGMVNSAYLYIRLSDKVITTNEGVYERKDFYEKQIVDDLMKSTDGISGFQVRQINEPLNSRPVEVVSFYRKLPLLGKDSLGLLVVNVKKDSFFEAFRQWADSESNRTVIAHSQTGQVIYANHTGTAVSDSIEAYLRKGEPDKAGASDIVKTGEGKYFINSMSTGFDEWELIRLVPYSRYSEQMGSKTVETARMTILVILFGFLLAYLFSLFAYRPWKKITSLYSSLFEADPNGRRNDEYMMVHDGIARLMNENQQIKSMIELNKPIVRHRLIYDLLNGNSNDMPAHRERLEQMGIETPGPYYTALIVHIDWRTNEAFDDYSQISLYVFGSVEAAFQERFPAFGSILDEGRLGFIVNVDRTGMEQELQSKLTEICLDLSESVQMDTGLHLQFSFGDVCHALDDLHRSYDLAKKGVKYKALFSKTDVVFMQNNGDDRTFDYPLALQKQLVGSVKLMDRVKTGETVSAFFKEYVYSGHYPPEKTQETIILLLSAVMHELIREGYEMESVKSASLMQIHDINNNKELEAWISGKIEAIVDELEALQDKKNDNLYVSKAIRYMEENYDSALSISDISSHVALSSGYLSRIFKSATGDSPLDYLNKYRIGRSKELLAQERKYSLQEISEQIGYKEAHSFIRFFKKYEAITPGEYRKAALEQRGKGG
ncbi:helix-turn-helix domain-containing protein [Paenibacillus contaminans]|uniref:HTH araC/xylS-type domain-containing protein n=1 Tax=Paenibacillus contaminans TaxID=450362 RepID=A0A329LPY1_9BACL|nr:helix-turn-helix domain-containing protein [Paenibacillus contaminans]RAV09914.1 hypothetical protein DQG23_38695 [Paenibacillus contaminans]